VGLTLILLVKLVVSLYPQAKDEERRWLSRIRIRYIEKLLEGGKIFYSNGTLNEDLERAYLDLLL
jgi:hypothetical protein